MKKISGVYKITNTITGDFYIGSSINIMSRWAAHRSPSTWKERSRMKIYQAFQEYSLESFDFEIIEETDNLKEREQYFISLLNPAYNTNAANIGMTKEEYHKQYKKQYRKSDKGKEVYKKGSAKYKNRLCEYEGKILTLNALQQRFRKAGIENPAIESKKYLIE